MYALNIAQNQNNCKNFCNCYEFGMIFAEREREREREREIASREQFRKPDCLRFFYGYTSNSYPHVQPFKKLRLWENN